jgi:hypothetical protein
LAVAAYEEALRRDDSNATALRNLLLLAEAAGSQDAAATYQRRVEALESGKKRISTTHPLLARSKFLFFAVKARVRSE